MKDSNITLDDLGIMIKSGFDEVHDKMDKGFSRLEGRMDNLEGRMDNLEGRMDKVENRLFSLEKSHEELKELVNGIFRVEIYDLKRRVALIEEKLGIRI
jgi:chromosome segregation ATPase